MIAMGEDAELLRRFARTGEEAAFAELVRRYLGLVYHAALRQLGKDGTEASDVTQKVFVLLARKAAGLTGHTTLAGWLHATTRNVARDTRRGEGRRRAREQEAGLMPDTTERDRVETAAWERLRPVIDDVLTELDERDREIVLLRFFADLPHAQIGARLGIAENAARMRVERALERLHAALERRGITSTAAALGLVLANQVGAAGVVPAGLATSVVSAALTGATGLAPLGGVAIGFMTTTKLAATVAVIVGVAGLGTAIHQSREAAEAKRVAAALRDELENLRSESASRDLRRQEAEQQLQTAAARIQELEAQLAKVRNAATGQARVATPPATATSAAATVSLDPGLQDPEYVRLSMQKYRAELGSQYAPLYRWLDLPAEAIARFEENRTRMRQAELDFVAAAGSKGVAPADPALASLVKQMMGEIETELRTLLGDHGYRQYSEYRRALPAMEIVGSLAAQTYGTPDPLQGRQGEALARIVVDSTATVPATPGSRVVRYETDWPAVATDARRILSPAQAAAFQALVDLKELQARMSAISRQVRSSPPPAPP